jgi:TfoX/Sxy family transcriptional regulator of competence genes
MFGGLAFLVHGNMACGVRGGDLIVRLAADVAESVQDEPGVRPFDLTGRPMTGWLLVAANGHAEDDDLRRWVDRSLAHAGSLPPK